jgi:hypothetical protein|tara:strand:+ start:8750 stop:9037 length:288 start_codon:yes stop_codon:yes gene_type:complete
MTDQKVYKFVPGDILLHEGETYQVHENLGLTGLVSPFPSVDVVLTPVEWSDDYRKIGHEGLPGPTPCATGNCEPPAEVLDFRSRNEIQPIRFIDD